MTPLSTGQSRSPSRHPASFSEANERPTAITPEKRKAAHSTPERAKDALSVPGSAPKLNTSTTRSPRSTIDTIVLAPRSSVSRSLRTMAQAWEKKAT